MKIFQYIIIIIAISITAIAVSVNMSKAIDETTMYSPNKELIKCRITSAGFAIALCLMLCFFINK